MRTLIATGLVFALAAPLAAQTGNELLIMPAKNGVRTYVFKQKDQTGNLGLTGKILKVEGTKVSFTVEKSSASWTTRKNLDDFQPVSAFRIMQVVTPDTAEGQLGLARYGIAHDVPVQAKYALRMARRIAKDPSLAADLDKQIADKIGAQLKQRFEGDLAAGRVATAKGTLREINRHYADAIPASTRDAMRSSLQSREAQFRKDKAEERAKQAVAKKDKEFHRKLKPLRKRVEMGDRDVKQGLNAGSSMSKALGKFRNASKWYNQALRGCDRLKKKYGNEGSYATDINYLRDQATKGYIGSLLNEASILTSRGSFNRALGNVNKILAMDNNNSRALSMRGRIESAANEGWGGGRIGRR